MVSDTECQYLKIQKEQLFKVIMEDKSTSTKLKIDCIRFNHTFRKYDQDFFIPLSTGMHILKFLKNDYIITRGEIINEFNILIEGKIDIIFENNQES